jgi:DNA replication and repair protein RecF
MRLVSLRLHDFRSYKHLTLLPPDGVTVFVGENGAGKTNLLEAVHLCCLGRSHRTSYDRELIRHGQDTAAVQVRVERRTGADEVGVRLYTQQKRKKLLYVNGKTASRIGELIGHVTCVMFSPEDLDIAKGAPALRRRFMDMLLSQSQPAYFYALQRYNTVMKQRNALLHVLQRGGDMSQLSIWDEQISMACAPVVRQRQNAAIAIDKLARAHYSYISGKADELFSLEYCGSLSRSSDPEADMLAGLAASREEDIHHMSTGFGPHRDDIRLMLCGQDIKAFGSQGQMRTAVLAMRLSELDLLTEKQEETPLLLLDDVLSELDISRRARLMSRIGSVQTLLTCTDLSDLADSKPAAILHVHDGQLSINDGKT